MRGNYDTAAGPFISQSEGAESPVRYRTRITVLDTIGGRSDEMRFGEVEPTPGWVVRRAEYRDASIPGIGPEWVAGCRVSTPHVDTANATLATATARDLDRLPGDAGFYHEWRRAQVRAVPTQRRVIVFDPMEDVVPDPPGGRSLGMEHTIGLERPDG